MQSFISLQLDERLITFSRSLLSHIINLVHPRVKKIVNHYITDEQMWASAATEQVALPKGLSSRSKEMFDDIIKVSSDTSIFVYNARI